MWFLAMAAAAFTSIAAGSRHNITVPFMIIFILVLLTSFLNVEYGFFSMMGILFLFSITSRISLRHARYVYLKSGGKTIFHVEKRGQENKNKYDHERDCDVMP